MIKDTMGLRVELSYWKAYAEDREAKIAELNKFLDEIIDRMVEQNKSDKERLDKLNDN